MKLPMTVSIMGATFKVDQVPVEGEAGSSNPSRRTITINPSMPEHTQLETFYHEVAHNILCLTGVAQCLGEGHEEAVAQAMGYGLASFIRDNRELPQ